MGRIKNFRVDGRTVIERRILKVGIDTRRNNRAVLCAFEKDMLGVLCRSFKTIGVIESATVGSDDIGKSLKIEK